MAESSVQMMGAQELLIKLDGIALGLRHTTKLLNLIGNYLSFRIKKDTILGRDVEGESFIEYTKRYAKYREKHGRPTHPVDLFFTGSMSNALTYEAKDNEVNLFFMNTTDKFGVRNPNKAFWLQTREGRERVFFAIGSKDIIAIEKMVKAYVNQLLKKKVGRRGGK